MLVEKIDLYAYFGFKKPNNAQGVLTSYVLGGYNYCEQRTRPAMLILPGGGYAFCSQREGEPVAIAYNKEGFNCYVLEYSCKPAKYPTQFIEAAMAMAYIRENAAIHATDVNHVCAIGFSAGGHLCACLATMYEEKFIKDALGDRLIRPDGVILAYAVITSGENALIECFTNLCGDDLVAIKYTSVENRVNENSSPAFIWTTYQDKDVPFQNSVYMAMAYAKYGVPVELHLFEHGRHGLSLGTTETSPNYPYVKPWFNLSINWLTERGFTCR